MQAYVMPDANETHELRLSHETITDNKATSWSLLQNSVIDPITGSTRMRLLHSLRSPFGDLQVLCADLTLPAHSIENVLPMLIDMHVVFSVVNAGYGIYGKHFQVSPVGLARGLCIVVSNHDETCIGKFNIDMTGERCVGIVSDLFPLWPAAENNRRRIKLLDSSRGKVCYTGDWGEDERGIVVTLDLE
jgi:hypothetical protein